MSSLFRRLLLLVALMFWQGGFMFYGAVVVPVGASVLGSHREQGFVTQSVTNYLNLAGAVALTVWAWELAKTRWSGQRRRAWLVWGGLVAMLGSQAWLHTRLDELLVAAEFHIVDEAAYGQRHQWYLIISTAQWAGSLALLALTVGAWHAEAPRERPLS